MVEMLDVFDADFKLLGKEERTEVHKKGLWHQTFFCWIVRSDGKIVVQLRSKDKSTNPNMLDISSAGHISSGETVKDGVREIKEELGLDVKFEDLTYLGYFKWATDRGTKKIVPYRNREFCHTFFLKNDMPLNQFVLQPEELDGIFEVDIQSGRELFSKEVDEIKIKGYIRKEDNTLEENERIVKREDFTKFDNFWLRTFNLAEDFLNGRRYLTV